MRRSTLFKASAAVAVLLAGSAITPSADAQVRYLFVNHQQSKAPRWIGVASRPADATLRAQLGLKEDQGLIVDHVAPDSPAAKAGLLQHDVIVAAGDQNLASMAELSSAVRAAEKSLELKVLRGGQEQTLTVEPSDRPMPKGATAEFDFTAPGPWGGEAFRKWMEEMQKHNQGPHAIRLHVLGPEAIVNNEQQKMPANLRISVHKQGDEPAKITVQQGDQSWETTADKLDALPEEIQPHVKRMLGGQRDHVFGQPLKFLERMPGRVKVEARAVEARDVQGDHPGIDKQVRELQRAVDELRKQLNSQKAEREAIEELLKRLNRENNN